MQITNTKTAYGWLAIALHWVSAVGVIWIYFAGEAMEEAATREARAPLLQYHISLASCFFVFLAGRVIWSFTQPKPASLSPSKLDILAKGVQHLFLAMIAIMIISGPLAVLSTGNPIKIFDFASIPSPFLARNDAIHEAAETVHGLAANLFWPLLIVHLLGAAKSLVIAKDRTMQRMLWVRKGG